MPHIMQTMLASLQKRPDAILIKPLISRTPPFQWTTISYAIFLDQMKVAAAYWHEKLQLMDLKPHDVVGLWLTGHSYTDLIHLYSICLAGYVPQVFSVSFAGVAVVNDLLAACDGKALLYDPSFIDVISSISVPSLVVPAFDALADKPFGAIPPLPEVNEHDTAMIFHTSGTTSGKPKPVKESHIWLHAQARVVRSAWIGSFDTQDVISNLGSFAHVGTATSMSYLSYSGQCLVETSRSDFGTEELKMLVNQCGVNRLFLYAPWLFFLDSSNYAVERGRSSVKMRYAHGDPEFCTDPYLLKPRLALYERAPSPPLVRYRLLTKFTFVGHRKTSLFCTSLLAPPFGPPVLLLVSLVSGPVHRLFPELFCPSPTLVGALACFYAPWLSSLIAIARTNPEVFDILRNMRQIAYTGAAFNPDDEAWVVEHDIPVTTLYATTEVGPCMISDMASARTLPSMHLIPNLGRVEFIPAKDVTYGEVVNGVEQNEKTATLYDFFVHETSPSCPHPDIRNRPDGHITGDLFEEVRPGWYVFRGRNDDWIRTGPGQVWFCDTNFVVSVLPVRWMLMDVNRSIEDNIFTTCSDVVYNCTVVGHYKPAPVLFVEPISDPADHEALKRDDYDTGEDCGCGAGTLPRTSEKGNIRRKAVEDEHAEVLGKIYATM
ncbi:acetyl-CoA synthetase-like protein [Hymenopellis radicata]|nr:acetyl-CoA synthetase-like protein [Hymenopellis radicata]